VTSNRKTYLKLKQSMREFFRAPVRFLKESNEKESVFEKPYLDTDYRAMHLDIPEPDWPTWKFDTSRRRYGEGEVLGTGPHCKGCDLSYYRILAGDCATDSVQFYSSARCVSKKSGLFPPPNVVKKTRTQYYRGSPDENYQRREVATGEFALQGWGSTSLTVEALVGEIVDVQLDWFADARPGIEVWVNPAIGEHVLLGTMVDDLGNVCTAFVEITCAVCPPETAFSFDDASTSDTIAPGGSTTVYVLGGSPPFTWGSAGLGYTWGSSTVTMGRQNILSSASGT